MTTRWLPGDVQVLDTEIQQMWVWEPQIRPEIQQTRPIFQVSNDKK